jgi:hypothetical protein
MCAPPPAGNVEEVAALFDALFLEAAMPSPFRVLTVLAALTIVARFSIIQPLRAATV